MKLFPQKDYHELFRISILVKALDGCIEIGAGLCVFFLKYTPISAILFSIFHEEIVESPRDLVWGYLIKEWHALFLSGNYFWGFLFLAHGVTKVLLSIALLKNYLWAYPLSAVIFALFAGFELYSTINHPSLFLGLITAFDIIVVGLILNEYRYAKKNPRS
jgi:uncharacterized membrane protein